MIYAGAAGGVLPIGQDFHDTLSGDAGADTIVLFCGSATINGGDDADLIEIMSTDAGTTTRVDGGASNDHIRISPVGANLDTIAGAVVVNGGGNDSAERFVSTGGVRNVPPDPEDYCDSVFEETVASQPEGDTVDVFDNSYGATGNTYVISPAGGQQMQLTVDKPATRAFANIVWEQVENLNFFAGMKNDMVVVQMPDPGADALPGVIMIDGGAGADNYMDFQGSAGDDAIVVDRRGGRQVLTDAGSLVTVRSPFEFSNIARIRAEGEEGNDVLYSKTRTISVLEGDGGQDELVNGHVIGTLDSGVIRGPIGEGADASFLLGGAEADGLWGSGNMVTYLPDAYAVVDGQGVVIDIADDPSDGDIISFSSGTDTLVISRWADCLSASCGTNTVLSDGTLGIDVCAWLYATFLPIGGFGTSADALPDADLARLTQLTTPPEDSDGEGEAPLHNRDNPLTSIMTVS